MNLAQITLGPNVWEAIGILAAVAGVLIAAYGAFSRRSQERTVTISPDTASKADLEAHRARTSADIQKLHERIERVTGEINGHICEINRELGGLSHATKQQNEALDRIESNLYRLSERRTP